VYSTAMVGRRRADPLRSPEPEADRPRDRGSVGRHRRSHALIPDAYALPTTPFLERIRSEAQPRSTYRSNAHDNRAGQCVPVTSVNSVIVRPRMARGGRRAADRSG